MVKHAQMVELLSRIALEFAESPLIPYNFRDFTRELELFEQDLERYAEVQVEKVGRAKPVLHFDGLKRALNSLKLVSENYQEWAREWKQFIHESGGMEPTIHTMLRWRWNDNMVEFNGQFLTREIQHQRAGYKNILLGCRLLRLQVRVSLTGTVSRLYGTIFRNTILNWRRMRLISWRWF